VDIELASDDDDILMMMSCPSVKIHNIIFVDDMMKNVKDVANAYKNDPEMHVIVIHFKRLAAIANSRLTVEY